MARVSIFIVFLILFTSSGFTKSNNCDHQTVSVKNIDTSIIAVLPYNTSQYSIFKNAKQGSLNSDDFKLIEVLLNECINEYNPNQEKDYNEMIIAFGKKKVNKSHFIIELKRYKRQYIVIENSVGEKEVWINCFCDNEHTNWKTTIVDMDDGGNCYFNLKINLTQKKYYELRVNGTA